MISNEELIQLYDEILAGCTTLQEQATALKNEKGEYKDQLRRLFCDWNLYTISRGYTKYKYETFEKDKLIQAYLEIVRLLPKEYSYYHLTAPFFKKDFKKFLSMLEKYLADLYTEVKDEIREDETFMSEGIFINSFFEPFKQAFDGFWPTLGKLLGKYPCQKGIPELCGIVESYYNCKTDEEAVELLQDMMIKYPDIVMIRELVGYTYYSMKMWHNAIAYFESVEETGLFFMKTDLYYMLAWCHGKVKDYRTEEKYYRMMLEDEPENVFSLNCLGYCLYTQKRYQEALEILKECLELDSNYIYASNNYVRCLIALGRNKDAKAFVKSGKYKIAKEITKRVEKLDDTNARIKKEIIQLDPPEGFRDDWEEEAARENRVDLGIKRQQFSNEKLLEDELTARIESGVEVFGLKLKVYKRKGVYGRQLRIAVGRLDLLCEDAKGDLYVIELKKDSGYDDAYKQTVEYLDWFEKDEISKGKNVYGIICLNSPSKELIEKVHQDKRMKLFEYQISYREI